MANTTVSTQKPGVQKTKKKMPARSKVLQRRETFVSYMFLLPALIFFVGFVIFPYGVRGYHQLFYQCQFFRSEGNCRRICQLHTAFSG